MDKSPIVADVKKPPPRRKAPVILYLMIALSFSIVLGTVLLSRDMAHLRSLATALGIDITGVAPPKSTRLVFQGPPRPSNKIRINSRFLKPAEPALANAFRRVWQMSGPDMCRTLRSAGIEPTAWQPAVIGGNTFECSYDKVFRKTGKKIESSLFVIVRGNSEGIIKSMRVKLVDPALDSSGSLDPQLLKIFETMLTQSRWGDFSAELEAIRTLNDVKKDGFGAVLRFAREFNDTKSFNFVLNLETQTADQRRANPLFSRGTWFEEVLPPPVQPPQADGAESISPNQQQPVNAMPQFGLPPIAPEPPPARMPETQPVPAPAAPGDMLTSPSGIPTGSPTANPGPVANPAARLPIPLDPTTNIRSQPRNPARFQNDPRRR